MKSLVFCLSVALVLTASLVSAADVSKWKGTWGNKPENLLECEAKQVKGDQWTANFTGYYGKQFAYKVEMKGVKKGDQIVFEGTANLGEKDGEYRWTGIIDGDTFNGKYQKVGKEAQGKFQMKAVEADATK